MRESEITKHILLAIIRDTNARLFRHNVGTGWVGKYSRHAAGRVLIHDPRPLHAGLHKGAGDLIGWTPVVITPEMVGRTVAVFTSLEVKTARGRVSSVQQHWIDTVAGQGGISGVARSGEEALEIIRSYRRRT